jgi:hypothetical protein
VPSPAASQLGLIPAALAPATDVIRPEDLDIAAHRFVSPRASKYRWLNEGRDFRAASNTLKTVAVRRRKWNLP